MKVEVDREKCIGCGLCVSLCSEVFELKEGKSSVKKEEVEEKLEAKVKRAADLCPAKAIKVS